MSESPKLHALNCPNCSAPLEYDGASPTIKCSFCGAQAAVPDEWRAEAAAQPEDLTQDAEVMQQLVDLLRKGQKIAAIQLYRNTFDSSLSDSKRVIENLEAQLGLTPGGPEAAYQAAAAANRKVGLWVTLGIAAVLIFVGAIVAMALLQPGGPLDMQGLAVPPAMLVPGAEGQLPGVAFSTYNVNKETRSVSYYDPNTKKNLWTSAALNGDGFVDALGAQGGLVYAATGSDLLAWNQSDGSLAWQTKLTDSTFNDQSLIVLGGRVIVLTQDMILSAFDAQTGKPAWSRPLRGYDRRMLAAGGLLLLPEYTGDTYDFSLFLLNPTDGTQVREIAPVCVQPGQNQQEERFDSGDGLVLTPDGQAVYLVYGSFFGCVQRFDLTNGQKTLEIIREDAFDITFYGFNPLFSGDTLYFGTSKQLLKLDGSSGSLTTLLEEENWSFIPLAESNGSLIVRAFKTIGSRTSELWGVSTSGGKKWQHAFESAEAMDEPNGKIGLITKDGPGWSWQMTEAGLQVLEFQAEPNQLVIETLNPADGISQGELTLPLRKVSGDFYSVPDLLGRQGNLAWYLVDTNLMAFDVAAGKIEVQR